MDVLQLKNRLYQLLEHPEPSDRAARAWSLVIGALIGLNILALAAETVDGVQRRMGAVLDWVETVSVTVFAAEYVLRMWVITCSPKYAHPLLGRLRYAVTPLALIDLLAVAPSLLAGQLDLRFMRAARLARLMRVLKLARYTRAFIVIGHVLRVRREELVVSAGIFATLLVMASSLMYFAEHDAQPEAFSSIPASMWWAVVTLTTVGYGDVYPVTHAGKILAGVIALLGIGSFALPTAILGAGFLAEFEKPAAAAGERCPVCGAERGERREERGAVRTEG